MATKKTEKTIDFAKAYQRLEDITREFEAGDLSMEEGLKKFEEGLALASECKQYLREVENKIVDIKKKFDADK